MGEGAINMANEVSERMRRRMEQTQTDMETEAKEGLTCGGPHRSLVRGINALGENDIDICEVIAANGGKHKGRTFQLWPPKLTNLTDIDLFRVLIFLGILYLIMAHAGLAPSRMGPRRLTAVPQSGAIVPTQGAVSIVAEANKTAALR